MATKTNVNSFLREFKRIASKRGITLIARDKNELAKQGLTKLEFQNEIIRLNYKNYCKGPQSDKDMPGNVWIFGKIIGSEEYYIKLKINSNRTCAVCLSFHAAEYPLDYPLK